MSESRDDQLAADTEAPAAESGTAPANAGSVLFDDLTRISVGLADLVSDTLSLWRAESKLAASALVLILMLAVMTGLLLAAACVLLVALPVVWLIELGWLGPSLAVLVVAVALLLMAWGLTVLIGRLARDLRFPRTRQALSRVACADTESKR